MIAANTGASQPTVNIKRECSQGVSWSTMASSTTTHQYVEERAQRGEAPLALNHRHATTPASCKNTVEFSSDKCIILRFYQKDTDSEINRHFSLSLKQHLNGENARVPNDSRLPASFWTSSTGEYNLSCVRAINHPAELKNQQQNCQFISSLRTQHPTHLNHCNNDVIDDVTARFRQQAETPLSASMHDPVSCHVYTPALPLTTGVQLQHAATWYSHVPSQTYHPHDASSPAHQHWPVTAWQCTQHTHVTVTEQAEQNGAVEELSYSQRFEQS